MTESLLVFGAALLLAWPLGRYLAAVMRGAPMRGDRLFGPLERLLFRAMGIDAMRGMRWRGYALAFLLSNLVLGVCVWLLFMAQGVLPLNPDGVPGMRWDLALHTMVSFLTNTNQQHYSGQAQLSYLSQMVGIVGLQVVTPMMGLALVVATLRGLFGGRDAVTRNEGEPRDLGNFWVDVTRASVRVLLPLCLLWSVLLTSQGVPATLEGARVVTPVDQSAGMAEQVIPVGPVAPMVAVKQLGTNGGGWYGPNSSVPLENPTPFSNALELLAIVLLPMAVVFMVGPFTGRRKLGWLVFGCMVLMSALSTGASLWSESASSSAAPAALMEGKEVRFGVETSALWSTLTTQTSNGSVNAMHDSLAPLTGGVSIVNMLVNAIWGGVGCGLQQFLVYLLLSVFLAGLMTGRTPEVFGRKLEAPEVRLLALLVVLQPVVVLGLTAITLLQPQLAGTSNPGFHGIGQVFYEYVSAFANNGSGFEGLGDATPWWNLSATLALILGRYPALIVPLAIAGMLAKKRVAPEGAGTLPIETPTFALTVVAIVMILTVLQFMPALVLGPIADHLSIAASGGQP
ncbi:potassium-transporting ATPase subunit KdpA [Chiayiivirga flava]|uniref:Potassium-transporting ATPase potassium-binding subunit n=1 Tax=Chiayiivirga flava TaxID=659595 RepID=A0A7W8D868_9GAMM|nr:potassium-transporting ATPase subunit KdpA [Chiayiivirga flava]MBB5208545.1 K+-transporting ATPase ATPase A chain [Chiayiivirga flava]